ncbi:MAG: GlsB/YeaQ/YmgE family stress response membrane protein [Acidobacteriota bacterium]
MDLTALIVYLIIGAISGWLAGQIMKGRGFGAVGNIIVGIVGAFLGGVVFGAVGISVAGGLLGSILTATVGAVILLFVIGVIKKA